MSSESKSPNDFGTPECLERMWLIVAEQCIVLDKVVEQLRADPPAAFPFAHLLFHAVLDSAHSVLLLLEKKKLRDCFPLARCVLETTINACYIAAVGECAGSQAVKHAVQKAHRDNFRGFAFRSKRLKVGWTDGPIPPTHPAVEAALAEYSSKKGHEITSWTPESLEQRVKQIERWLGEKVGDILRFSIFAIYRFSSEIAHGTLYSVLRFVGVWDIPPLVWSAESVALYQGGLATEAALIVADCVTIAIQAVCKLTGDQTYAGVGDELVSRLKEMRWAQNLTIGDDGRPLRRDS